MESKYRIGRAFEKPRPNFVLDGHLDDLNKYKTFRVCDIETLRTHLPLLASVSYTRRLYYKIGVLTEKIAGPGIGVFANEKENAKYMLSLHDHLDTLVAVEGLSYNVVFPEYSKDNESHQKGRITRAFMPLAIVGNIRTMGSTLIYVHFSGAYYSLPKYYTDMQEQGRIMTHGKLY